MEREGYRKFPQETDGRHLPPFSAYYTVLMPAVPPYTWRQEFHPKDNHRRLWWLFRSPELPTSGLLCEKNKLKSWVSHCYFGSLVLIANHHPTDISHKSPGFVFHFIFLATPHSMWDLSSWQGTKPVPLTACIGSRVLTTGPPGMSLWLCF